jgi:hypothetical protein
MSPSPNAFKAGFLGNGGPQTSWTKNKAGFKMVKDTVKKSLWGLL